MRTNTHHVMTYKKSRIKSIQSTIRQNMINKQRSNQKTELNETEHKEMNNMITIHYKTLLHKIIETVMVITTI